ncbi:MAG TPA: iron-sulfur cluster repair di-iron protein [Terriglobales bacterium]|nr:iron-sulfur cluster repair di-iron protein [Terriglobales bacterium]
MSKKTVAEIALDKPASVRVFEELGIDYCCGGNVSLEQACAHAGVSFSDVQHKLASLDAPAGEDRDWSRVGLDELTTHIVERHHAFIRREAPHIELLLAKVVARHGAGNPEYATIEETFRAVSSELMAHMLKEEKVLFPLIAALEAGATSSVRAPITRMMAEHDDAATLLRQIRSLSHDFVPPDGACPTLRATLASLDGFERDLHLHVHLENNLLFPRALALTEGSTRAS